MRKSRRNDDKLVAVLSVCTATMFLGLVIAIALIHEPSLFEPLRGLGQ